ncbi:ATPase [Pasteurellaceae bacterium Orientalotternb1]|nr:ATPase [Pasteurellaceae bacterium Orientalotternb1]
MTKDFDWRNELEKTVLNSLVTTFGLDFLLMEDKKGGDVDTIHNVKKGIYATDKEKENYKNREKYNSHAYHSDPRYIQKGREDKKDQEQGTLQDKYRGNEILENRKGIRQLDHTISGKEISNDPARILAELNGIDLANQESNLNSTHWYVNNLKRDHSVVYAIDVVFPKKVIELENSIKIQEEKVKSMPTNTLKEKKNKKLELEKLEKNKEKKKAIEQVLNNKDKIIETDKKARYEYNRKINYTYYSSSKFFNSTVNEMNKKGLAMGARQALGLVCAEVWFELRNEFPTIYQKHKNYFDFKLFLTDIKNKFKKIWERIKNRFSDLFTSFKDSYIAGVLASLNTTILNIFLTTEKMIGKMIRELWNSLIGIIKLIFFNPKRLAPGDLLREALKLLALGVSTLAGSMLNSHLNGMLLFPLANEISMFISALITGILNLGFIYFLEHSEIAKKVWEFLNSFKSSIEIAIDKAKEINAKLDNFLVQLTRVEFNMNVEEIENFSDALLMSSTELERSLILEKEIKRRNIGLPFESGNSDSFRNFLINKCKK